MEALAGPAAAAALLLVAGGAPKAWAPGDTARALRGLRLPVTPLVVRALGVAEAASGGAFLVSPGRATAAVIAAWYAVFAAVVALALRSDRPLATCGCFGRAETPPTVAHLLLVVAASVTTAAFALAPATSLLAGQPALGLPFIAFTALTAWFGYLMMSRLAALR